MLQSCKNSAFATLLCYPNSPTFMDCLWARALALGSRSVGDSCAWDLAVLKDATFLQS